MERGISIIDALTEMKAPNFSFTEAITYDIEHDYDILIWGQDVSSQVIPTKEEVRLKIIELELNLAFQLMRMFRNGKLTETDFYIMSDYPHSNETTKQAWVTYRQQLRDLPQTSSPQLTEDGELTNVTWPTPPDENNM